MTELTSQIAELQAIHKKLKKTGENKDEIVLSGQLPFEAAHDGFAQITDSFEIEMLIPNAYPDILPRVTETGGKIDGKFEHVFSNGFLCLAVPVEMRRIFHQQPSLLGFVNRLVIPYFFGYCYWKEHGEHPFGEQKHGGEGIIQYYMERLNLGDEVTALAFVCSLYEHGYRGHQDCPCGSGRRIRKCHGPTLMELHRHHTLFTLRHDLVLAFEHFDRKLENGQLSFPDALTKQVGRILKKSKL